jgi:biotin carboxylase
MNMKSADSLLLIEHGGFRKGFLMDSLRRNGIELYLATNHLEDWVLRYIPAERVFHTDTYSSVRLLADIVTITEEHGLNFSGVGTFWEHNVTQAADLAAALDLPGAPPGAVRRSSSNKLLMRQYCRRAGIPTPRLQIVRGLETLPEVLRRFPTPAVIKPLFGVTSLGVMKIENQSDLATVASECQYTWSAAQPAYRNFPDVWLLEEYLPGIVVSVDGIVQAKRIHFAGVVEIGMGPEPHFVQCANWLPARITAAQTQSCFELAERIITALGLDNCGFHCELRLPAQGRPQLIEIAARLPGGLIPEAYLHAYGFDLAIAMANIWLGRPATLTRTNLSYITQKGVYGDRCAQVAGYDGLDAVNRIEGLWSLEIVTKPGELIVTCPDVPKPLYVYSIEASSAEERDTKERQVETTVKVRLS